MIILKFALALFLAAITWAAVRRQFPPAPVGGPYYYADAPVVWPLQSRYRVAPWQAMRARRVIAVDFDDRCLPVLARHLVDRREQWRMVWLWDRAGNLRCRLREDPTGRVLQREDFR